METIVKTSKGYVLVSTKLTPDRGRETMVFPCKEDGTVTNWGELDVEWHANFFDAERGHEIMVKKWEGK